MVRMQKNDMESQQQDAGSVWCVCGERHSTGEFGRFTVFLMIRSGPTCAHMLNNMFDRNWVCLCLELEVCVPKVLGQQPDELPNFRPRHRSHGRKSRKQFRRGEEEKGEEEGISPKKARTLCDPNSST